MKVTTVFRVWFLLVLVCCSALSAQERIQQTSLAILVYCEGGNQELAENLQPLIEAEASLQWDGRLVERAEIDKILDEMKISISGLADADKQMQLGKMIPTDCLLTVRVNKESVKTTLSLFPSTTIIHEKEYRERLEPQSLSVNIVTNVIKAYREHSRDPNKPQISIGSFFYTDPHRRFLDYSTELELQLRQELIKDKSIVLTERLFPSDLLGEFERTRAGITENITRNLSAPPSDILLYGEFQPKSEQDLTKPNAQLEFTLFAVSPTGLCENKKVEFSCYSIETEIPLEKVKNLIQQVSNEVRTNLASGQKRIFSQKEFEEFKKQAFQLMPYPPMKDGDYYKQEYYRGPSQIGGKPAEFERALHMLECAMLFKGDDTQVLVCAGAILNGMTDHFIDKYSKSDKKNFLDASLELIERAYFIESNWNTRGMYANFCLFNSWAPDERPSIALKAAQQIWNTRDSEHWHSHQIHSAFSTLFAFEKDFGQQYQQFLKASPEYEKQDDGLRELFDLFRTIPKNFEKDFSSSQDIQQAQLFAERLLYDQSIFLQALGHMLYIEIYSKMEELEKKPKYAEEFYKHLEASVDMIPALNRLYGKKFTQCSYSSFLRGFLHKSPILQERYNLKNNAYELMEKYIDAQMQGGNYILSEISILFRSLLPSMWEEGRYKRAYDLISQFLEHYTAGGSGDYDRMWLATEQTRFLSALEGKNLSFMKQLEKISFDEENSDHVIKVINFRKDIYGILDNPKNSYSNAKVFNLIPSEQQAHILKQISGDVSDIACTNSFIGISTKMDGFYLMDRTNSQIRHLTSQNSGLPSENVTLVCDSREDFFIGIPDKENLYTHVYLLNPNINSINNTDTKFVSHTYWRLKSNTIKTENSPVIPQTWNRRTAVIKNETLELLCSRALSAIKDVTVTNSKGDYLLSYKGFELSYVYDFTMWQGQLIFATGNGLYVSTPGSNELHCLISEPDLLFFSLCALDDRLYIGTSEGLYWVGADTFLELVKSVEQANLKSPIGFLTDS